MKEEYCSRCLSVLAFWLLFTSALPAQWIQSNLGQEAQIGYDLYVNGSTVYAATLSGVYCTSSDGMPWFSIGPHNTLIHDVVVSGTTLIAASDYKGVYIAAVGDTNWIQSNTGLTNLSVRALAKNSRYVFAGTWGGGVFKSSDNGLTWQPAGLTGGAVTALLCVGEIVFAGDQLNNATVCISTDNGSTWNSRTLPYPAGGVINLSYDGTTLFACDMGLYASTDMGNSWSLRYGVEFDSAGTPKNVKIFKDIIRSGSSLIASIASDGLQCSRDSGRTWVPFSEGLTGGWTFAAVAVNPPYLWALRDMFSNAYRRGISEIVSVETPTRNDPAREFQLFQNYPNPFNPSTTIAYFLPGADIVTVSVHNAIGQEICSIVKGFQQAGHHSVRFDAGVLPSGFYSYRVAASGRVSVGKMILQK